MVSFKPFYTSSRAIQFLEIINTSKKDDLPSYLSLCTFGLCISECPPPSEQKKQVLRTVWKHISTINVPEHYISCVEVWMSFTMQHVSVSVHNTAFFMIYGTIKEFSMHTVSKILFYILLFHDIINCLDPRTKHDIERYYWSHEHRSI